MTGIRQMRLGRKGKKKRLKAQKEGKSEDQNGQTAEVRSSYKDLVRESPKFVEYYKERLGLTPEEFAAMMETLQKELPTTFRISVNTEWEKSRMKEILQSQYFNEIINKNELTQLKWYPEGLAYQLNLSRRDIRRSELYFRLHNFLISATDAGSISRQETVSMIPPVLLQVSGDHKVLDMCAAPGSKTAQIIEHLDQRGFVVANDVDNTRCYMLVHQAKRLNSANVLIVNHDATCFPNIATPSGRLTFDRVLADVPCSGDGTLRKNPDIWAKWSHLNGNSLHSVQHRILVRGLQLLRPGGRLVYSTCTFNPIENEAVIHRTLTSTKEIELVDVAAELTGLKFRSGLTSFRPADTEQEKILEKSGLGPTSDSKYIEELKKCIRVYPHENDTGGFFVAVFTKKGSLPDEDKPVEVAVKKGDSQHPKRRRLMGYREDPYVFFKENEEVWTKLRDFYDLTNLDPTCLLTRSVTGKKKNIYYTTPSVRDLVEMNQNQIKIINTGVKAFARCYNKASVSDFRLSSEGFSSMDPFVGPARRIPISSEDLISVLSHMDPESPGAIADLSEETGNRAKSVTPGSCVLDSDNVSVVGWRGTASLRAYTSKPDALQFLRLLGADTSAFDVNKFQAKKDESEAPAADGAAPDSQAENVT